MSNLFRSEADEIGGLVVPKIKGGWAKSGTLTTGNVDRQLQMQVDFPVSGDYTVEFDLIRQNAIDPIPVAEISWTVAGNTIRRTVSVGNGISVTGTAEAVKVVIRDATNGPFAGNPNLDYICIIQVAPGNRPSIQQPPTLLPSPLPNTGVFSVAGGTTTTVTLPVGVGIISVFVTVVTTAAGFSIPVGMAQVNHQSQGGTALKAYDPRSYEWVPVSPATGSIQLVNNSVADTYLFSVTYGIDG